MKDSIKFLTKEHFQQVLTKIFDQVFSGKGRDRHGFGDNFEDQPWRLISDNVGEGFVLGQAIKKLMELKAHNQNLERYRESDPMKYFDAHKDWMTDAIGAAVYTIMGIMYKEYSENKINTEEDNTSSADVD